MGQSSPFGNTSFSTQTSFISLLLQPNETTLHKLTTGLPLRIFFFSSPPLSHLINVIFLKHFWEPHSPQTLPAFLGALSAPNNQRSSLFLRGPQRSLHLGFEKKPGIVSGLVDNGFLQACFEKESEATCSISYVCHVC